MDNFVVTFARGFGTGGKAIASQLAKELGIHCYENRILTLASQLSGLDENVFQEVNEKLREELEYYKNRKMSGRQKHNAKWMAIYNDFVVCYENGMTMVEIAKRNNVSERTIYRYKAYYDKIRSTNENAIE